jgi:hypothetical protein
MTAQSDPYVRVYYRIIDDPKFESVFEDDRALATWLRLLLTADATYPAPAPMPIGSDRKAVQKLVDVELVDLLPNHRYRMHGLAAEREQRSEHGRKAALARHGQNTSNARAMHEQSASNAGASEGVMHSEPLRTEPIQSAPLRTSENGSKTPETDAERLARYRSYIGDKSKSADIREAAAKEVELIESRMAVH